MDGFLLGKRYLLHDRDPLFTDEFRSVLAAAGVQTGALLAVCPEENILIFTLGEREDAAGCKPWSPTWPRRHGSRCRPG